MKTIQQMLDSLSVQTFEDWELILVDDGSKDGTSALLDKYASTHARAFVIHKPNGGLGSARVTGLLSAQGEYVIHVDADDWVEPDYVQSLYEAISSSQNDIVWCDIFDNDETLHVWKFDDGTDREILLPKMLNHEIWSPQWNRIMRRTVAMANAQYLEGLQQWEDFVFNVACLLYTDKLGYLPRPLYHYRVNNPESLCNTASQRIMIPEYTRAISQLSAAIQHYGVYEKYEYELNWNKLYAIRDYIDDLRVRDPQKFATTYPEAIAHINKYPDYPNRLKLCAWLILHRSAWLVPVVCKVDVLLRRLGLSRQA